MYFLFLLMTGKERLPGHSKTDVSKTAAIPAAENEPQSVIKQARAVEMIERQNSR
jgi:hypothetical protein